MNRTELFKKVGVKDEKEFYAKYPSEDDFRKAHPDIPQMFLGGLLKSVLPMAASFIPGVGGTASKLLDSVMGGGLKKGSGQGQNMINQGIGIAGNLIKGLFGKKNPTGMAPISMAGAAGAQMINSAQMQNEARDKFISGMQPNIKALQDQFGDDDNPLLLKRGGYGKYKYAGTVEDADIVPQSMRTSGKVNAEVESEEVVEDTQGNIEYVDPSNPHSNNHEQGGALMEDAQRVLEATSTKKGRNDWRDKALRLSPDQAEKITGVRPKTSVSHAGALMKADEHFGKQRAKYTKAIDKVNKMKRPDKLSMESAKLNFKVGKTLPTKENLFENLFQHQEEVKTNTGIVSGEEMQYGGVKKLQYGDPPTKKKYRDNNIANGFPTPSLWNRWKNKTEADLEEFRTNASNWGNKIMGTKAAPQAQVQTPKSPAAAPTKGGVNRFVTDRFVVQPSNLAKPVDKYVTDKFRSKHHPQHLVNRTGDDTDTGQLVKSKNFGSWDPMGERTDELMQDFGQPKFNTKTLPEVVVTGKKKTAASVAPTTTGTPKITSKSTGKSKTPAASKSPVIQMGNSKAISADEEAMSPGQQESAKSWSELRAGKDITGINRPQTAETGTENPNQRSAASGYRPERMDALDYKPLVDSLTLRKAPVRFTPIELEKARLKRVSARPAMNEVESDYRAALRQVGDDPGAVAQLMARKFDMNNQIRGNYENINTQIENQETLGNTEIANREKLLQNQNLDQFDAKIQARDANYNSVKNELTNAFGKNIRANRQFNRNAKMMLEFAGKGLYDQDGNFVPSKGYGFTGGHQLPKDESGDTTVSNTQINRGFDIDGRRVITGTTRTTNRPKKKMIGGKVRIK